LYALLAFAFLSFVLILMASYVSRTKPTMTRKRKKLLLDQQEFVTNIVKAKKVKIVVKSNVGLFTMTCKLQCIFKIWTWFVH
jgi:hypothetical protein